MNITLIANTNEFTAAEQKTLFMDGVEIGTAAYYLITDPTNVTVPAIRSLSLAANITWVTTTFRGSKVAIGSASTK